MKIARLGLMLDHSHKKSLLILSWFYSVKRFIIKHSNLSYLSTTKSELMTKRSSGNTQRDDIMLLSLARKPWSSCKNWSISCISTVQVLWNTKLLFNSNTNIFSWIWVRKKKKKLLLEKVNQLIYLKIVIRMQYFQHSIQYFLKYHVHSVLYNHAFLILPK